MNEHPHHPIMSKVDAKVVLLGRPGVGSMYHLLAFTAAIGAESILEALTNSNDTETCLIDRCLHGKFKINVTVLQQQPICPNQRSCIINR